MFAILWLPYGRLFKAGWWRRAPSIPSSVWIYSIYQERENFFRNDTGEIPVWFYWPKLGRSGCGKIWEGECPLLQCLWQAAVRAPLQAAAVFTSYQCQSALATESKEVQPQSLAALLPPVPVSLSTFEDCKVSFGLGRWRSPCFTFFSSLSSFARVGILCSG